MLAYVCSPTTVFEIVVQALEEKRILIYTSNQYRITSEIEQRVINDLNGFNIPGFRIKSEAVKIIKNIAIKRVAEHCNVDGLTVDFAVKMNNDEALSAIQNSELKIVFHDLFSAQNDEKAYIDGIKEDTQSEKAVLSVVPNTTHANEIWNLIENIARINDLQSNKSYNTAEEKAVVQSIVNTKEEKSNQLTQLVNEAYNNSTLIYCYNTATLTDSNYKNTLDALQRQMFDRIYTRRLSSTLSDDLAPKVLTAAAAQLKNLFHHDDFKFFDSAGRFIGEQLSVVTEILAEMKSYVVGIDLEKTLTGAPTGYTFGTIVTTLAALFRANKIIVKHAGQEFHSFNDADVKVVFSNTTQFKKASFKAVSKSLTYNERQEIVDTLKDDCNYKSWTGEQVNYTMNDYELVDAIRTLSKEVLSRINHEIMGDDDMEKKFSVSVSARNIFVQYTAAVTDLNYFSTAKLFLDENNNEDYIAAVKRVGKDLNFIKKGLPTIREEYNFILAVENELDKSGIAKLTFNSLKEAFEKMYETNIVANASQMTATTQQVKDHYYQLMKRQSEEMTTGYINLDEELSALSEELSAYPKEWNKKLYDKIAEMESLCKRNVVPVVVLNGYSTKCAKSGMQLRDMVYQTNQLQTHQTKVAVMETEIVKMDPTPKPQPVDKPVIGPTPSSKLQPKVRSMKQKMPSGQLSVNEYRKWLQQQLALLNGFDTTDILKFDE